MTEESGLKKGPFGRPIRVPLGTRNILTAPQRKGFVRRFVNDIKDRVRQYEAAGYTIARDDIEIGDKKAGKESQLGSVANPSVGAGDTAVLMEIKEEWYNEDQKAKQDRILIGENDMKRKATSGQNGLYPRSSGGLGQGDII